MMAGNITREEPMLLHRSVEGWSLRDRTGHFPRFERCFIGLFTASSMIVAGEGEAVVARRNDSPLGMVTTQALLTSRTLLPNRGSMQVRPPCEGGKNAWNGSATTFADAAAAEN